MELSARRKCDHRNLDRGEAQLMRVGHALWRDRLKLGDTVIEREGINAALESVWKAQREYRIELAKRRASRFSEYRVTKGEVRLTNQPKRENWARKVGRHGPRAHIPSVVSVLIPRWLAVRRCRVRGLHTMARQRRLRNHIDELIEGIRRSRDVRLDDLHTVLCGLSRIFRRVAVGRCGGSPASGCPGSLKVDLCDFAILLEVMHHLGLQLRC